MNAEDDYDRCASVSARQACRLITADLSVVMKRNTTPTKWKKSCVYTIQ